MDFPRKETEIKYIFDEETVWIDYEFLGGKIYRLYSKRLPNLQYIGSTIRTLEHRFDYHIRRPTSYRMEKIFNKYDDMVIELIEDFPCLNKYQLTYREQFYINEAKSLTNVKHQLMIMHLHH